MPNAGSDAHAHGHHTATELALMLDTGNPQIAHQAYNELKDLYKSNPAQYKSMMNQIYRQDKSGVGFDLIPGDEKGCFRLIDSAKDPSGTDSLYMGACEWGQKAGTDANGGQALGSTAGEVGAASSAEPPSSSGGKAGDTGASTPRDGAAIAAGAAATAAGAAVMAGMGRPEDEFDQWINGTRPTEAPPQSGDWLDKKFDQLSHSGDGITRADLLSARSSGRFADGTQLTRQDMLAVKNILQNFGQIANANTWFFNDGTISHGDVNKLKAATAR